MGPGAQTYIIIYIYIYIYVKSNGTNTAEMYQRGPGPWAQGPRDPDIYNHIYIYNGTNTVEMYQRGPGPWAQGPRHIYIYIYIYVYIYILLTELIKQHSPLGCSHDEGCTL